MRLSSILSGYVLKTSSNGDSPTSLGILFQCSHCKNFFLIQNEPSPGATFSSSPCHFHMAPCEERASNLFLTTTEVLDNCAEVPTEPPVV